ncbi:hypothetical protein HMPREF9374_1951 [Desmospora sp. 8437]|nr:hypothetical protein HMPREF9374_1951 [Desmospora sp. 8437]
MGKGISSFQGWMNAGSEREKGLSISIRFLRLHSFLHLRKKEGPVRSKGKPGRSPSKSW